MFSLEDKVVLITGAIGILGKEFCKGLAENKADLALVDLDEEQCEKVATQLQSDFGIRAKGYGCDITNKAEVQATVKKIVDDFSRIDVLFNNAASKGSSLEKFFTPYEEFELDTWKEIMSVNIDGMFLVSQAVGVQMLKQKTGGSIIQTASIYGVVAPDQSIYKGSSYMGMEINTPAVYSASKSAVIGLTKYLASYWGDKNIRVNTLTPGGIESGQNEVFKNNYSRRVPMKRMGNSSELVGALVFLASDASSYVTGQNIIVDGGLSAW